MDERIEAAKESGAEPVAESQEQAQEPIEQTGFPDTKVLDDGSVAIGGGCVIINQTPDGKLGLKIKPTKCGKETGKLLLDFLVNTAGKGVVIEIPSAEEEGK